MSIQSIDPATEEIIEQFEEQSDSAIETALAGSDRAFHDHRQTTFAVRSKAMNEAGDILEDEKNQWARIATSEMGKTLRSAVAEVEKCALVCRHYAEHAEEFLADESRDTDASRSFIRYLPIGPVLAVMPWNFPFLASLPVRGAGPDVGQRRPTEACLQYAPMRARHRRDLQKGGVHGGLLSIPADRS